MSSSTKVMPTAPFLPSRISESGRPMLIRTTISKSSEQSSWSQPPRAHLHLSTFRRSPRTSLFSSSCSPGSVRPRSSIPSSEQPPRSEEDPGVHSTGISKHGRPQKLQRACIGLHCRAFIVGGESISPRRTHGQHSRRRIYELGTHCMLVKIAG